MNKCEFKECKSNASAKIHVNENIGDLAYNTSICDECAKVVGLREGSDIPDNATRVNKLLREHYAAAA